MRLPARRRHRPRRPVVPLSRSLSRSFPGTTANYYSQVPGQTDANFVGTGWALSGGARIVSTVRADGRTGTVLELPSGAVAISPPICVTSGYPTARTMVRNVVGSEGVFVSVSYAGANYQSTGTGARQRHGLDALNGRSTSTPPRSRDGSRFSSSSSAGGKSQQIPDLQLLGRPPDVQIRDPRADSLLRVFTAFTPSHRGGSGPPLVCVHGFTGTWRMWELVLPMLERDHDVLAPTLIGHAGGPPINRRVHRRHARRRRRARDGRGGVRQRPTSSATRSAATSR